MLTPRQSLRPRFVTAMALAALFSLGSPSVARGADDPGGDNPGPVVCSGQSCTITATSPAQNPGTNGPSRPGGSAGTPTRPTVPGSGGASEVSFLDLLLASGPGPIYRLSENGPNWYLPENPNVERQEAALPAGVAPVVTPAELALQAVSKLSLPSPRIGTNPAGEQTVNFPTWLWIQAAVWQPVSATASVPGVSVTATAVPQKVDWSMGDGTTVACRGAGSPYSTAADPAGSSPDCGHTYVRSSASQPGHAYSVVATVTWTVSWAGAGQSGTFPGLQTAAQIQVQVGEVQGVVVPGPGG